MATKIQRCFNIVQSCCVNVLEMTLFQRGIGVDFVTSIGNQNSTLFQHCFKDVASTFWK